MRNQLANVVEVTKNSMTVRLEEARSVRKFEITEKISRESTTDDLVYIVVGKSGRVWLPLDVISVGTLLNGKEAGFHLTINPRYMQAGAIQ